MAWNQLSKGEIGYVSGTVASAPPLPSPCSAVFVAADTFTVSDGKI